jgi:cytochrome c oxidase assembly factor 2
MSLSRLLHLSNRKLVSSLFALTFFASVLTVSASNVLPCPARSNRSRYADVDESRVNAVKKKDGTPEKRSRRFIEETKPHHSTQ